MSTWDLQTKFSSHCMGKGLSRLWVIDSCRLVPRLDVKGSDPSCPITLEPFEEPVLLADGFVYEYKAAATWLRQHSTAPCTNELLPHKVCLKLRPLQAAVEYFLAESLASHPSYSREQCKRVIRQADELLRSKVNVGKTGDVDTALFVLSKALDEIIDEIQTWTVVKEQVEEKQKRLRCRLIEHAVHVIQRNTRRFLVLCARHAEKEKSRMDKVHSSLTAVQACMKAFRARQNLLRENARLSMVQAQSVCKTYLAQRYLQGLEKDRCTRLQKQLCTACHLGNRELVSRFIAKGADKDSCAVLDVDLARKDLWAGKESWGPESKLSEPATTALHAASREGHIAIVRLLCELRADTEAVSTDLNGFERTPLSTAALMGHHDVVRLLCEAGADVNCKAIDFDVALIEAAQHGDLEMARLLIGLNADVNITEATEHRTPVAAAAEEGHTAVVRLLCCSRADVDFGDALHIASDWGHVAAVKLLCEFRANVNSHDGGYGKKSPLNLALDNSNLHMVQTLLNAGAIASRRMRSGNTEIARLLREAHTFDASDVQYIPGQLIRVIGPVCRPENGMIGTVTDWDEIEQKWKVRMSDGTAKMFEKAHMEPVKWK